METVINKIDDLSDSDLIEATSYFLTERLRASSTNDIQMKIADICLKLGADQVSLNEIQNDLSADRSSHTKLFRFLLREAVDGGDDEQIRLLDESIQGTGQKQVVTEILVATSLATLATMYLIYNTKGKKQESISMEITELGDGRLKLSYKEETIYADSSTALHSLIKFFRNLPFGGND